MGEGDRVGEEWRGGQAPLGRGVAGGEPVGGGNTGRPHSQEREDL